MSNNDLISRTAAIEIAERYGCNNGSALGHHSGVADCIASEIVKLPAIDAKPVRHGRWGNICDTDDRLRECSVCHDWQIHYERYVPKFCPNCGAKMDGEGN